MRGLLLCTAFILAPAGFADTVSASLDIRMVEPAQTSQADLKARYIHAQTALNNGDYAAAYDGFSALLHDNKTNESYQRGLADSALGLRKFSQARSLYDAMSPSHARRAGLTLCDVAMGNVEDIELALNSALEGNLSDARLWNALGLYYDARGRHIDSQDIFIRAMAMGSDRAAAINNMGMSLMRQRRYDEALAKFEQASALKPSSRRYDNNRRMVLALAYDFDAAVKDMTDGRAAQVLNDAGYIALTRGRRNQARELFEKAIAASPVYFPVAEANLASMR